MLYRRTTAHPQTLARVSQVLEDCTRPSHIPFNKKFEENEYTLCAFVNDFTNSTSEDISTD